MKKIGLLGLGLLILLSGCSKKDIEVVTTTPGYIEETVVTREDKVINSNQELLDKELENNDSGVSNPHTGLKDFMFNEEVAVDVPDFVKNDIRITGDREVKSSEEEMREIMGDDYEIQQEYHTASELTDDLYNKMKSINKHNTVDFDKDGLSDYEEIEVYHTDPNKFSTSGDTYADGYKVKMGMELTKFYEIGWIAIDDKLSFLSENGRVLSKYDVVDDFLDMPGNVELLDVGMSFAGDIKYRPSLDCRLSDVVVEVYNAWTYEHAVIEFSIESDMLKWHVDEGYDQYIIRTKDTVIDIDKYIESLN